MINPYSALPSMVGHRAAHALEVKGAGSKWTTAAVLGLIFLGLIAALANALFFTFIFGGAALWIWLSKAKTKNTINTALGEVESHLRSAHAQLTQVRDEIASGSYNHATIVSRLKAAENDGVYVPSMVYSILAL